MKVHNSQYENDGWISLKIQTPPELKKVRFACINLIDWNLEEMKWETTGWIRSNEGFSLKMIDGLKMEDRPTHWKE